MNQKTYLVSEIAERVGGRVLGDGRRQVAGLCSMDEPLRDGIAFMREIRFAKIRDRLESSGLSAVLIKESEKIQALETGPALIAVKEPQAALLSLIPLFFPARPAVPGINAKSDVHPSAKIGSGVSIGAFSSVGENVVIGNNVRIYPHVTIYENVSIGDGCVIHSGAVIREDCIIGNGSVIQNGAVIGSDGFGYVPDKELGIKAVPQVGIVKMADRVDVGANACIDRAALGSTFIGQGTKIDNLVQIGHNTHIGRFSIICGHVGVAGSCRIGNGVTIGGHVGIADHVEIVDGVRVGGKSGVTGHLQEKGDYVGYPAIEAGRWRRQMSALDKLPETTKTLKRLTKEDDSREHENK